MYVPAPGRTHHPLKPYTKLHTGNKETLLTSHRSKKVNLAVLPYGLSPRSRALLLCCLAALLLCCSAVGAQVGIRKDVLPCIKELVEVYRADVNIGNDVK